MGALSHYLEQAGIATTQISLIYEHTETIRPPRALWVPFELGRPLGAPDDIVFQRKVLLAALVLLEAEKGPVLEIFLEEAPAPAAGKAAEQDAWACPVSFSSQAGEETDLETRIRLLTREVAELRTWYDIGLEKRGRTAVADFDPEIASGILCDYLSGKDIDIVQKEIPPAVAIRLAAQDLKSFYFEAAISRPGAAIPDSETFTHWYWTQTAASRILKEVSKKLAGEDDKDLQMTGKRFLVPLGQ